MKKIVLMLAIVASGAFAAQGVQAIPMISTIESVNQDEFVEIDIKDIPAAVLEAIQKNNEESVINKAFVAGADAEKKFKIVLTDKDGQEVTLILKENGEILS